MSKIEVDQVDPQSGTTLTLGTSGDTIVVPSGVTFNSSAATNTLPSSVVTTTGTQTLTNKSIVATQLTGTISTAQIADDAVTLAKMASGTDGNIISYDASGNPVAVATGSAGQVLTSAGAGAPPTFAAISASGVSEGFQAITSGSGTSSASGAIVVNDELFDDGSNYSTSNGRYTAPSTGHYLFFAGALQSGSAGTYFYFTKNGSAVGSQSRWGYNGAGNQIAMNINMIIDLSAGDYINIYSSAAVYINQFLNFGGCKLY